MSHDDYWRRVAQDQINRYPDTPNLTEYQQPDYRTREVINNELNRVRSDLLVPSDKKQGSF